MADTKYEDRDLNDGIAEIRALIPDTERLADPAHPEAEPSYLFDDVSLARYVKLAGGSIVTTGEDDQRVISVTASSAQVLRAAAHACEALGSSEMLVLKKITSEDLATDGAVLANQYGAKAKRLRDEAQQLDDGASDDGGGFFLHPFVPRPAGFDAQVIASRGWPW